MWKQFLVLLKKIGNFKKIILYCKPHIRICSWLLLVEVDGQITGTISLRKIREDSGEIKRMYVRPNFRGEKLGNLMIEEVIRVSKETGFSKLYLDTAHFMSSAISLYKNFGFKETGSYPESVHPKGLLDKMIFMMKEL